MAPVNDEKRLDMHLETASLQAVVLFLPVLFKLVNGAILFPDESKGVCTQRIRYVVGYIIRSRRGFFPRDETKKIEYLLVVS